MSFLRERGALVLTLVLLLQAALFYTVARRPEATPVIAPLATFPTVIGSFQETRSYTIDPEVAEVLKADDTLSRQYNDATGRPLLLFIAYFQTQRYGQSPHSPKNCLPGSGWEPTVADRPAVAVQGRETPIVINRYVVQKGDYRSVALYWYQSHNRVIASELSAKLWLVADAVRYRRSDTALVRVSVPVAGGDVDAATELGFQFIRSLYPQVVLRLKL